MRVVVCLDYDGTIALFQPQQTHDNPSLQDKDLNRDLLEFVNTLHAAGLYIITDYSAKNTPRSGLERQAHYQAVKQKCHFTAPVILQYDATYREVVAQQTSRPVQAGQFYLDFIQDLDALSYAQHSSTHSTQQRMLVELIQQQLISHFQLQRDTLSEEVRLRCLCDGFINALEIMKNIVGIKLADLSPAMLVMQQWVKECICKQGALIEKHLLTLPSVSKDQREAFFSTLKKLSLTSAWSLIDILYLLNTCNSLLSLLPKIDMNISITLNPSKGDHLARLHLDQLAAGHHHNLYVFVDDDVYKLMQVAEAALTQNMQVLLINPIHQETQALTQQALQQIYQDNLQLSNKKSRADLLAWRSESADWLAGDAMTDAVKSLFKEKTELELKGLSELSLGAIAGLTQQIQALQTYLQQGFKLVQHAIFLQEKFKDADRVHVAGIIEQWKKMASHPARLQTYVNNLTAKQHPVYYQYRQLCQLSAALNLYFTAQESGENTDNLEAFNVARVELNHALTFVSKNTEKSTADTLDTVMKSLFAQNFRDRIKQFLRLHHTHDMMQFLRDQLTSIDDIPMVIPELIKQCHIPECLQAFSHTLAQPQDDEMVKKKLKNQYRLLTLAVETLSDYLEDDLVTHFHHLHTHYQAQLPNTSLLAKSRLNSESLPLSTYSSSSTCASSATSSPSPKETNPAALSLQMLTAGSQTPRLPECGQVDLEQTAGRYNSLSGHH